MSTYPDITFHWAPLNMVRFEDYDKQISVRNVADGKSAVNFAVSWHINLKNRHYTVEMIFSYSLLNLQAM